MATDVIRTAANCARDTALTSEQVRDRKSAQKKLQLIQVASIVIGVASILSTVAFLSATTVLVASVMSFSCYEVLTIATNIHETLQQATFETSCRISEEGFFNQMKKGSLLARFIFPFLKGSPRSDTHPIDVIIEKLK